MRRLQKLLSLLIVFFLVIPTQIGGFIGVDSTIMANAASNFGLPLLSGNIITFGFGARSSSGSYHLGIDYGNYGNAATDVLAIADGVVYSKFLAANSGGWGNFVILRHETTDGKYYFSGYGHMADNSISVSVGDKVTCGMKLGVMGSTGNSTGPHVHLFVCKGISSTSTIPSGYNASSFSSTVTKNGITYYNPSTVISTRGTCIYGTETISVSPTPTYADLGTHFYAYIINTKAWKHATNDSNNVSSRTETGAANQIWYFDRYPDGSYCIMNASDGLVLQEIPSGGSVSNVAVGSYTGSSTQFWTISGELGKYVFSPNSSPNHALELPGCSSNEGENIRIVEKNSSDSQYFQIWRLSDYLMKPSVWTTAKTYPKNTAVTIFWSQCLGATGYWLTIYKDGDGIFSSSVGVRYSYDTSVLSPGHYEVYVEAFSDENNWKTKLSDVYSFTVCDDYTVKFNGNGATSGSMSNQAFTYDVAQNLTANAFKRAYTVTYNYNYSGSTNSTATAAATFNGWATSADGAKVYNDKASVKNLATSGTYNLYANWTLGSVTLPTPTRTGYTFAGWNTKADGTGTNYAAGTNYKPTANVTLYAKWTANPPVITPVSGAAINSQTHQITGLTAGGTSAGFEQNYVSVSGGSFAYEYPTAKQVMGTGTKINVYNIEQTLVDTYTVVIFGDVDGDSWYDGTDAYFVRLVANGLIARSALTDAQLAACDANHDGTVDNADVALLEQAGLLLAQVDQTMPSDELQTDSAYLEYCGLIDQSIEITEPEQPAAEQPAQTAEQPAAPSVWGWIKTLFTIVLNWLLRVF